MVIALRCVSGGSYHIIAAPNSIAIVVQDQQKVISKNNTTMDMDMDMDMDQNHSNVTTTTTRTKDNDSATTTTALCTTTIN